VSSEGNIYERENDFFDNEENGFDSSDNMKHIIENIMFTVETPCKKDSGKVRFEKLLLSVRKLNF